MAQSKYRNNLPQLSGDLFLTDGGMETTLVFHQGIELPEFAAFTLLKTPEGRKILREYFDHYLPIAVERGLGFVLESATWRANPDWAEKIGYSREELAEANRRAIEELVKIRDDYETEQSKIVISGNVGPRGDGYVPDAMMSADEAATYHAEQINTFAGTEADLVTSLTLNYVEEAIGIARAAQQAGMPVVISFTVETDGKLPTGQSLGDAIEQTDSETGHYPVYHMINCAHPSHFDSVLDSDAPWLQRIRGVRANASAKSHAELNDSTELDPGDAQDLSRRYKALLDKLPQINILGGCCGTDHRHVEAICVACADSAQPARKAG